MLSPQAFGGMALHLDLLPRTHLGDQDFVVHRGRAFWQQICSPSHQHQALKD